MVLRCVCFLSKQQVREQERNFASKIRSNVSKKKEEELQNLAAHLKQTWEREHKEKSDALQRVYERSLGSVGDGHRAASIQVFLFLFPNWYSLKACSSTS